MKHKPLILVIDDETFILKTLKEILEDEGYQVETLSDGNKTIDYIGKLIPDLVFLDIFMPNCNGMALLEQIKKEFPAQKVFMISGFGNIPIAIESLKKGALDFIEKPLNLNVILKKINFLNEKQAIQNKTKQESDKFLLNKLGIIGNSYLFLELLQQVNLILNLDYPLIIYGEHGTGKSLFVKYIHQKGSLKKYELITINCLKLKDQDIIKKTNKFYSKQNGIIYIKYINKISKECQRNLLINIEKIQDKNKRLIVSSTEPLLSLVKKQKFNSVLFHTINVTPLEIPSLNKRRYDIPLMCESFIKTENIKLKKNIIFDSRAIRILRNKNWFGNIRELKKLIQYVIKTFKNENGIISEAEIFEYLEENQIEMIEEQSFTSFKSLTEAMNNFEKKFLLYFLKKNKYDIKQASNNLNLTSVQLKDKLLKLNINIKN